MTQSVCLYPENSLDQLVEQILVSRKISRIEQQRLMSILLSHDILSTDDNNLINQVFDAVRQGLVRVVD